MRDQSESSVRKLSLKTTPLGCGMKKIGVVIVWFIQRAVMDYGNMLLATGGYDHCIKFWYPHDGVCYRTVQHPDSVSYGIEHAISSVTASVGELVYVCVHLLCNSLPASEQASGNT